MFGPDSDWLYTRKLTRLDEGEVEKRMGKVEDWRGEIQRLVRSCQRETRKIFGEQNLKELGFVDAALKRRQQAMQAYFDEIASRYGDLLEDPDEGFNEIIRAFLHLNLLVGKNYNQLNAAGRIIYAAAIGILDIVEKHNLWNRLYLVLPDYVDEDVMISGPVNWNCTYHEDLVNSVYQVLMQRYHPDPENYTDLDGETALYYPEMAKGDHLKSCAGRTRFEALVAILPEEEIEQAIAAFRELWWQWMDRYYAGHVVMARENMQLLRTYREKAKAYNAFMDQEEVERRAYLERKQSGPVPGMGPLMPKPPEELIRPNPLRPFSAFQDLRGDLLSNPLMRLKDKLVEMGETLKELEAQQIDVQSRLSVYHGQMVSFGSLDRTECEATFGKEVAQKMVDLKIADPYAICFALLILLDRNDDMPWLFGSSMGMIEVVMESLPWAFYEYDELYDPIAVKARGEEDFEEEEEDEEEEDKDTEAMRAGEEDEESEASPSQTSAEEKPERPPLLGNPYERKYQPSHGEFLSSRRSLAQVIYEETGFVIPRDLSVYDERMANLVHEYGVDEQTALSLLLLFTSLNSYLRRRRALNLDEFMMSYIREQMEGQDRAQVHTDEAKPPVEEKNPEIEKLREEIRLLRDELHESESNARRTAKKLEEEQKAHEMDRGELAGLREYVYEHENAIGEVEEKADDETLFPYEVRQDTVVFGGHETWSKQIKPRLRGNIRFIDRDLNFNPDIIRNAQHVWIQANSLSHSQFYKIIEAVRLNHIPVHYFSNASSLLGAKQVRAKDLEED
ncbi:MAG: hypothetical protein IJ865_01370 [Clostridia bacterium]|nr:hypothetical protein [Clostridia bacterium]